MPPKKPPKLTPEQAKAKLEETLAPILALFTPEAIANGHKHQLELLTCNDQAICLMCSRRAGKSIGCVALCCLTALKTRNVYCLYLSLTADQSAPRFSECKALLDKFDIPYIANESDQTVTLHNGSRIRFTGTDDRRRIQALLGDQLASGVVIIDEAQSDPGLLEWLLKEVLGPMVNETTADKPEPGRIVVAGVVPDAAAGHFWRIWKQNIDTPNAAWKCMGWGRADNPHEHNFRKLLDAELKILNLSESDPIIQRNWFGAKVFDANATAYRYNETRNAYTPPVASWSYSANLPPGKLLATVPPFGVDTFAVGLDPASKSDRYAVVLWGWGKHSPDVYQIAEWVTDEASGTIQSQWVAVLIALKEHYRNIIRYYRDAGSAAETIDLIQRDHKLLIEAVSKGPGSLHGRVERFADLLATGKCHIIQGSQLEMDLKLCRWDLAARDKGKWAWSNQHHGDVADAASYGLNAYFDFSEPKRPPPESAEQMHERLFRESFAPQVQYGYQEDPSLSNVLGDLYDPSQDGQ